MEAIRRSVIVAGGIVSAAGAGAMTWTRLDAVPLFPTVSVTTRVTWKSPAAAYAWVTTAPEAVPPSPNCHEYEAIPWSSVEADASSVSVCPTAGLAGDAVKDAVGGRSGGGTGETVTVFVARADRPPLSVTFSATTYEPAEA